MATITWVGKQVAKAQIDTLTVTAVAVAGTLTVTISGKSITYTCVTGDTITTAATALCALLAASLEGELREITWANPSAGVITATGPDDGAPVTISKSQAGGATCTLSTTTAPTSPHDLNDGVNWSGGAVPGSDTAVFENSDVDAKYNGAALTAAVWNIIRRESYTGRLGLPDRNEEYGYVEYRAKFLETAGLTHLIEQAPGDQAQQVRIKCTSAAASTITVTGPSAGGTTPGQEPIEITGQASTSALNVSGAGVAVAPLTGQTSVVPTLRGNSATLRLGTGVTLTTASLTNCSALILCSYTTLTIDRGGDVQVGGSAVGTTTNIDAGRLEWKSTGTFGTLKIGSDGIMDLTEAPTSITPTAIEVFEGYGLLDPAGRLAKPFDVDVTRCGLDSGSVDFGTHYKITVSAHS